MENKDMKELNDDELELVNGGRDVVLNDVRGILASKLGIAKSSINLQSHIIDDLGSDSLDVVDVVQSVADKYNVAVDRPYSDFKSVADICRMARPKDFRNM